jgi:hypothetical protein
MSGVYLFYRIHIRTEMNDTKIRILPVIYYIFLKRMKIATFNKMKYVFNRIYAHIEIAFNSAIPQGFSSTICKLHCGVRGVRCLSSFLDRHVLPDTDALRNPQRQLASDR